MPHVLVFPCGTEVAAEIHRSLSFSTHYRLFGASSADDHGRFLYAGSQTGLPYAGDPRLIGELNNLVRRWQIDFLFPAHDAVIAQLAPAAERGELQCSVITSPAETCAVARSKSRTYVRLDGVVPTPKVYQGPASVAAWPAFAKPDEGQGSRGAVRINTPSAAEYYIGRDPSLILMELLPGDEFTVDCFTDRHGVLRFVGARTRSRVSNGISVRSEPISDPRIELLASAINAELRFQGVWFFQLKEDLEGNLVLLEIAPRVAGTMSVSRARGVNLPLLSLFDAQAIDVEVSMNSYGVLVDRSLSNSFHLDIEYEHVYIDLDDLLIVDGRVNVAAATFVHQCHRENVSVHLVTRHEPDLEEALRKHRLSGLFDSVTWIRDGTCKSEFVTEPRSIFIDDSFAERAAVLSRRGVPVFDGHMLECLAVPPA